MENRKNRKKELDEILEKARKLKTELHDFSKELRSSQDELRVSSLSEIAVSGSKEDQREISSLEEEEKRKEEEKIASFQDNSEEIARQSSVKISSIPVSSTELQAEEAFSDSCFLEPGEDLDRQNLDLLAEESLSDSMELGIEKAEDIEQKIEESDSSEIIEAIAVIEPSTESTEVVKESSESSLTTEYSVQGITITRENEEENSFSLEAEEAFSDSYLMENAQNSALMAEEAYEDSYLLRAATEQQGERETLAAQEVSLFSEEMASLYDSDELEAEEVFDESYLLRSAPQDSNQDSNPNRSLSDANWAEESGEVFSSAPVIFSASKTPPENLTNPIVITSEEVTPSAPVLISADQKQDTSGVDSHFAEAMEDESFSEENHEDPELTVNDPVVNMNDMAMTLNDPNIDDVLGQLAEYQQETVNFNENISPLKPNFDDLEATVSDVDLRISDSSIIATAQELDDATVSEAQLILERNDDMEATLSDVEMNLENPTLVSDEENDREATANDQNLDPQLILERSRDMEATLSDAKIDLDEPALISNEGNEYYEENLEATISDANLDPQFIFDKNKDMEATISDAQLQDIKLLEPEEDLEATISDTDLRISDSSIMAAAASNLEEKKEFLSSRKMDAFTDFQADATILEESNLVGHPSVDKKSAGKTAIRDSLPRSEEDTLIEVPLDLPTINDLEENSEENPEEFSSRVTVIDDQDVLAPSQERIIGNKYKIISLIGEGSLGKVYKVQHILSPKRKYFALKILSHKLTKNEKFRRQFIPEIETAMEFRHSHAIQVRDFGETSQGRPYYTMDFSSGIPLDKLMQKNKTMKVQEACQMVLQILSVLEEAHDQKIVHHNIRPDNILVEKKGDENFLRVLHFGLGKISPGNPSSPFNQDLLLGRPDYLSPEQIKRNPGVDSRSDLYSLSTIFYEMVTGQKLFSGQAREILVGHTDKSPASPRSLNSKISPALNNFILKGLEKKPTKRYSDAQKYRKALFLAKKDKGGFFSFCWKLSKASFVLLLLSALVGGGLGYQAYEENQNHSQIFEKALQVRDFNQAQQSLSKMEKIWLHSLPRWLEPQLLLQPVEDKIPSETREKILGFTQPWHKKLEELLGQKIGRLSDYQLAIKTASSLDESDQVPSLIAQLKETYLSPAIVNDIEKKWQDKQKEQSLFKEGEVLFIGASFTEAEKVFQELEEMSSLKRYKNFLTATTLAREGKEAFTEESWEKAVELLENSQKKLSEEGFSWGQNFLIAAKQRLEQQRETEALWGKFKEHIVDKNIVAARLILDKLPLAIKVEGSPKPKEKYEALLDEKLRSAENFMEEGSLEEVEKILVELEQLSLDEEERFVNLEKSYQEEQEYKRILTLEAKTRTIPWALFLSNYPDSSHRSEALKAFSGKSSYIFSEAAKAYKKKDFPLAKALLQIPWQEDLPSPFPAKAKKLAARYLSKIFYTEKNWTEARTWFQRTVPSTETIFYLCLVYYQLKEDKQSLALVKRLKKKKVRLNIQKSLARVEADLYMRSFSSEKEELREALEKAIEFFPKQTQYRDFLEKLE